MTDNTEPAVAWHVADVIRQVDELSMECATLRDDLDDLRRQVEAQAGIVDLVGRMVASHPSTRSES